MKDLTRGYIGGVICSTGSSMMAQDIYGSKEAYIQHLQTSGVWMDLHWSVGFIIALSAAIWAFSSRD